MQPNSSGIRPNRPTATSWVQMTTSPSQQQQQQQLDQQHELNRISLSSSSTTTSASIMSSSGTPSGSGSSGPMSLGGTSSTGSTSTSTSGGLATATSENLMVSAPNSFNVVPGRSPRNSMTINDPLVTTLNEFNSPQNSQAQVDEEQQQEENRKLRLQLYVFVLRCISYPFNAKQTNSIGLHHKNQQLKLRKPQLEQITQMHTRYIRTPGSFAPTKCPHQNLKLAGQQLKQLDELYERAHLTFNRKFLQNERMRLLVESECFSQQDLRELFRQSIERTLKESQLFKSAKQQQHQQQYLNYNNNNNNNSQLQTNNGFTTDNSDSNNLLANREIIINSWLIKFESIIRDENSENSAPGLLPTTISSSLVATGSPELTSATSSTSLALQQTSITSNASQLSANSNNNNNNQQQQTISKEQLYQMFQNILNIKKFEHQLLYNALQLDSSDEQAAAVRRELDGRISKIAELERNKKLMPKFVLKEMESLYLEETRMSVNKLMVNLDSLPVMKGSSSSNESRYGLQKFRRYNNR